MRHRIALLPVLFAVALPALAEYRTPRELFDAMLDAQQARAQGVSNYALDVVLMGQETTQYFERAEPEAAGSRALEAFRLVPLNEVQRRLPGQPGLTAGTGEGGLTGAGLPPGLTKMLGSRGAGPRSDTTPWNMRAANLDNVEAILDRARIVGTEPIDGRNAYVVRAEGLELAQISDGAEYLVRSTTLWVDTEHLVSLKMRMDGQITQRGDVREMSIEKLDQDYRRVPGSDMILPYRSLMRMSGMLGPKEQQEMGQARQQLAELDRQMASMPPDQQQMMQSMMGPRLEAMRGLVDGGDFEIETIVRDVRLNQGIEAAVPRTVATPPSGGATIPAAAVTAPDPAALQQSREACLKQKIEQAQAGKKKKKRFGKFVGAVGRIAGRYAGGGLARDISRVSTELYAANATMQDLESAAEALGITKDDIAACENPQ